MLWYSIDDELVAGTTALRIEHANGTALENLWKDRFVIWHKVYDTQLNIFMLVSQQ